MILLDAYALVAFVRGEAAEPDVGVLLRGGDAAITTVNLAEAVDVLARVHGIGPARSRGVIDPLAPSALAFLPFEIHHAWRTAQLHGAHYHPKRNPVSLADCALLASASRDDAVATADRPVLQTAAAEGIRTVPLPDSRGSRP